MSEPRLGRDVFLALAAVGWADGRLDDEEAEAIVRAAGAAGLAPEDLETVRAATVVPTDLAGVDLAGMTKADRLFVYAVAAWLTRLDTVVTESELDALARLGDALRVPARPRAHADAIAHEVAALPPGDRPSRYDLTALRQIIEERLALAQAARREAGSPAET